jgi:hypothetical protein
MFTDGDSLLKYFVCGNHVASVYSVFHYKGIVLGNSTQMDTDATDVH